MKAGNEGKKQPRILLIDDDESICETLATVLEEHGYRVEHALTGKDALKKARNQYYNMALIDIRLPDMDGTELIERLEEHNPGIVKIMITGYPSLENAVESLNKGADGYVIKPFKMDELLKVVEKHLKRQEEDQSLTEERVAEYIKARIKRMSAEE
ncbi:MAG: response regulator [Candidatus Bathyarchaeia archaeon]|nr:response regulator [Candidatus Bathyarchaeota archaeon]